MLKLIDIRKDPLLMGIVTGQAVKIVSVEPVGEEAVTVYYRDATGQLAERMLFRSDEPAFSPASFKDKSMRQPQQELICLRRTLDLVERLPTGTSSPLQLRVARSAIRSTMRARAIQPLIKDAPDVAEIWLTRITNLANDPFCFSLHEPPDHL
jgi:hypothetical protein